MVTSYVPAYAFDIFVCVDSMEDCGWGQAWGGAADKEADQEVEGGGEEKLEGDGKEGNLGRGFEEVEDGCFWGEGGEGGWVACLWCLISTSDDRSREMVSSSWLVLIHGAQIDLSNGGKTVEQ